MMKFVSIALLFIWGFCDSLHAVESGYPVFPLKQAPIMDAKWDSPAWVEIPAAVGFSSIKSGSFVQTRQTSFKMGWHGKNLYYIVKCEEPEPDKVKFDENNYRDGWYPDDNLEFFFTADNSSNKGLKQFVTNSKGARWCNFAAPSGIEPWAAAASKGADFWCAEVKIPFAQLDIKDDFKKAKFWFNLARGANNNPEEEKNSCYAPVKNGFGDAANFVMISFKDASSAGQLAAARKKLNKLGEWTSERLWKIANVKETFLAEKKDDENLKSFMELKDRAKKMLADKKFSDALKLINEYDKAAMGFSAPTRAVKLQADKKNAAVKFCLNGKEITPDAAGKYNLVFPEGLSVITAECIASGSSPSVRFEFAGLPENSTRWKISTAVDKDWMDSKFSDEKWATPVTGVDGFMWGAQNDSKIYMRQIVLWESKPFGKFQCINPPVREWLFSMNSTETLFLSLYPLMPFAPENYEFFLDIPEGFELLEMNQPPSKSWHGPAYVINAVPKAVKKETIKRDGMNYLRYRIAYDKKDIPLDKTFFSMLPVRLNKWDPAKKETKFYFHRMSDGNFTELENELPVGVLPPINGRMLKKIMISQYCATPYFGSILSESHLKAHIKDAVDAGMNYWMIVGGTGALQKILTDAGATPIGGFGNYPLWGCRNNKESLYKILQNKPDVRAQFFNNTKSWEKDGMYCPSWAAGEGRSLFKDAVRDDYAVFLTKSPVTGNFIWANWEGFPWMKSDGWSTAQKGDESYCFCPRCKKEFVKYAALPEGSVLSDDDIFKTYYKKWFDFRSELDGKIQGVLRDALAEIGKKYIIYSQTQQREFWRGCNGNVDYVFLGCPGNAAADSKQQEHMDTVMKFFEQDVNIHQITGQRFSFYGPYYMVGSGKKGPLKFNVMSGDGLINAKSWKSQIIRMTASLHGGVDMQSSIECSSGMLYYIGEATRAIADFEDLFYAGKREDSLAASTQIKYPNLLVLTKGTERLVIVFNENDKPLDVELENKNLKTGQKAKIWENPAQFSEPAKMKFTVPAGDVVLVHII